MDPARLVAGLLALALLVYLGVALFAAERFE